MAQAGVLAGAAVCGVTPTSGRLRYPMAYKSTRSTHGTSTSKEQRPNEGSWPKEFSVTETNFAEGHLKLKLQSTSRKGHKQSRSSSSSQGPAIRITIKAPVSTADSTEQQGVVIDENSWKKVGCLVQREAKRPWKRGRTGTSSNGAFHSHSAAISGISSIGTNLHDCQNKEVVKEQDDNKDKEEEVKRFKKSCVIAKKDSSMHKGCSRELYTDLIINDFHGKQYGTSNEEEIKNLYFHRDKNKVEEEEDADNKFEDEHQRLSITAGKDKATCNVSAPSCSIPTRLFSSSCSSSYQDIQSSPHKTPVAEASTLKAMGEKGTDIMRIKQGCPPCEATADTFPFENASDASSQAVVAEENVFTATYASGNHSSLFTNDATSCMNVLETESTAKAFLGEITLQASPLTECSDLPSDLVQVSRGNEKSVDVSVPGEKGWDREYALATAWSDKCMSFNSRSEKDNSFLMKQQRSLHLNREARPGQFHLHEGLSQSRKFVLSQRTSHCAQGIRNIGKSHSNHRITNNRSSKNRKRTAHNEDIGTRDRANNHDKQTLTADPLFDNIAGLTVLVPDRRRGRPRKVHPVEDLRGRIRHSPRSVGCKRSNAAKHNDCRIKVHPNVCGGQPVATVDSDMLHKINKLPTPTRERVLQQLVLTAQNEQAKVISSPVSVSPSNSRCRSRREIHVSKRGTIYVGKKRGRKPKSTLIGENTIASLSAPIPWATSHQPGFTSGCTSQLFLPVHSPDHDITSMEPPPLVSSHRPTRGLPTKAMLKFSVERPGNSPQGSLLSSSPSHLSEISSLKEATPSPISTASHSDEANPSDSGIGTDNNSTSDRGERITRLRPALRRRSTRSNRSEPPSPSSLQMSPGSMRISREAVAPQTSTNRSKHRYRSDKTRRRKKPTSNRVCTDAGFGVLLEEIIAQLAECRISRKSRTSHSVTQASDSVPDIFRLRYLLPTRWDTSLKPASNWSSAAAAGDLPPFSSGLYFGPYGLSFPTIASSTPPRYLFGTPSLISQSNSPSLLCVCGCAPVIPTSNSVSLQKSLASRRKQKQGARTMSGFGKCSHNAALEQVESEISRYWSCQKKELRGPLQSRMTWYGSSGQPHSRPTTISCPTTSTCNQQLPVISATGRNDLVPGKSESEIQAPHRLKRRKDLNKNNAKKRIAGLRTGYSTPWNVASLPSTQSYTRTGHKHLDGWTMEGGSDQRGITGGSKRGKKARQHRKASTQEKATDL
uniref:SET-binding protein-like n=1 Tax=Myxine glutinosa TaxID=7769 RepID=UPI00358F5B30